MIKHCQRIGRHSIGLRGFSPAYVLLVSLLLSSQAIAADYIEGTITNVMAGTDAWYGVRFYLSISSDQSHGVCNSSAGFVYSEPETGNGHKEKVAIFTTAWVVGKPVNMTVVAGRNGYCKLTEGMTL